MNFQGLKRASRQCLLDSGIQPRRLTLLFLLCFYALSIPCDCLTYVLEYQINRLSGLSAATLRNRYYLWTSTITVVINVVWVLWAAGYSAFALHLSRGQQVGFMSFPTGFRLFGKVLALAFLQFLYIWLWSILMVIPGIIAAYRYRMALYALLDDPSISASEAINISKRLTYGHKQELFLLDLSYIWYYLLGATAMLPLYLYNYGMLPVPQVWQWFSLVYLSSIVLHIAVEALFRAQVQTTYAHAYNWLLSLDQARRHDPGPRYDSNPGFPQ